MTCILDIGGRLNTTACSLACKYGCKVIAVDISPDKVEAAHQRVRNEQY